MYEHLNKSALYSPKMLLKFPIIVAISLSFVISGTQILQNSDSQLQVTPPQQGIPQMPQQPGAQLPPAVPFSNFTASIPLATSLYDVMKSKIAVSLADAMTNVTNSLGPNATALSASIQSEGGFLVYRIAALDNENNIHMILVDPANGSTLLQRQWPAAMPEVLSSIPGIGPQFGDVPRLRIP